MPFIHHPRPPYQLAMAASNELHARRRQGEAIEWVRSLELFEPRQFQKFEACDFSKLFYHYLLASFIGPLESRDHLRVACDLMNFYFAFDEYTDVASREEAKKIASDVMDAFRTRPSEPSSSKITEMARQRQSRDSAVHADFDAYTTAVIQEADDRSEGRIRTVEDYFALRRDTCGAKPSFSFFALGLNMPTEVFEHPVILSLVESATDLIAIVNDMHSYGLEHSRGLDCHNVITSIMHEHQLDLQAAYTGSQTTPTHHRQFLSDKTAFHHGERSRRLRTGIRRPPWALRSRVRRMELRDESVLWHQGTGCATDTQDYAAASGDWIYQSEPNGYNDVAILGYFGEPFRVHPSIGWVVVCPATSGLITFDRAE
ncbi:isoprenoid synthase domain-containing protein [Pholiota molesta]|nr:isoprenoid synthase domain-containing protein [Pholiota molesta]